MQGPRCLECGATLAGRFCHACGQKRIEPSERTLRHFAGQLFGALTDFDSRLLRSLAALVLRPGLLGAEWLAGRRSRWLSPLALFLIVNLIYFIAPPMSDFNLSLGEQSQQWYGPWAQELVAARLAARGIDQAAYAHAFALETYSLAKLLVILHALLLAPVLWLLHWRRGIPLVDHLAVALHLVAFALLVMMLFAQGATLWYALFAGPSGGELPLAWKLGLLAALGYGFGATLRRAYGQPIWLASLKAPLALIGAIAGHLWVYRALLFLLAFALS